MPHTKLKIIKVPREPIPDIKPSFPKLDNLHLELLENKVKLKKGLPLIPIKRRPMVEPSTVSVVDPIADAVKAIPKPIPSNNNSTDSDLPDSFTLPKNKSSRQMNIPLVQEDDDDIVKELGDDPPPPYTPVAKPSERIDTPAQKSFQDDKDVSDDDEEVEEDEEDLEKKEEMERQDFFFKLKIFKKNYKDFELPSYTEHTDKTTLQRIYTDAMKEINLDDNIAFYKNILYGSFLAIEVIGVKMGLNMKGYARKQQEKREKYDRLLNELGEKSYFSFSSNWPVEVRLLGAICFDTVLFILGNMATQYFSNSILGQFGQTNGSTSKKPSMRGPSVRAEDIRNMK